MSKNMQTLPSLGASTQQGAEGRKGTLQSRCGGDLGSIAVTSPPGKQTDGRTGQITGRVEFQGKSFLGYRLQDKKW